MTPRDRVIRTLNHLPVDRAPRDLWLARCVEAERADEIHEINIRFPSDILQLGGRLGATKHPKGAVGRSGCITDAWGCIWQLDATGAPASVVESPLTDSSRISAFCMPDDLHSAARFSKASRACEGTCRFTLVWSEVRPFERFRALRGARGALHDLTARDKSGRGLLAALHAAFCQEMEQWAQSEVDGVVFQDDLGDGQEASMSLEQWRGLFKPMYQEYADILHARDKFVFFHTATSTPDLFGDLVEVKIDAIHAPQCSRDVEKLSEHYRGRVTFWSGGAAPPLPTAAARRAIHESVLRLRRALDYGAGGVIAQCQWSPDVPMEAISAFFEQWQVPLPVNV